MGHNKASSMAHIADLMAGPANNVPSVGLNNYIARALSPQPSNESMAESALADEKGKERYIWRMHQPADVRKYQLFPSKDKLSVTPGRNSPDPEQAFALAMSQSSVGEPWRASSAATDRPFVGTAMRIKIKEQSLLRRRKPSVSDLGLMTTVQEVAMDSPTIPGRPPLHERSASAPGYHSWRRNISGDARIGPTLDESVENILADATANKDNIGIRRRSRSGSPKGLLSPKTLAPLVIPSSTGPTPQQIVARKQCPASIDSPDDVPPTVPPKSARMLDANFSPQNRTPFTPLSSSIYTPMSGSTVNLSLPSTATPLSAVDGRASPFPAISVTRGPSPMGHLRGQSDTVSDRATSTMGHRREQSEASIMDRGRPKKRTEGSPVTLKRTPDKRTLLAEQKAYETLPEGIKAAEAQQRLNMDEIEAIKKQAIGQAAKFEVLGMKDVESLSRELRALDERCEYLRNTHHSLRSGRRNLHERICTYLRSPRTAQFSHNSLLKQEEALIELDQSIDDWVSKLEHAENRRMRVRQKLLEHVAAALTIPNVSQNSGVMRVGRSVDGQADNGKDQIVVTRHVSIGEETPPRSPIKVSMGVPSPVGSPERLALPLRAQTQSMQEFNDAASRMSKESIRIYADSDVYALLADVEAEITRMSIVREESQERLNPVAFIPPALSRNASPVVQ